MKKIVCVIVIILGILIAGIVVISEGRENTDVTEKKTKVGFVMIGECDDNSYNQSHFEGMKKVAETLNLDVTYEENVPTDEKSKNVMENLIADGCEIIICNSYDYGESILEVAKKYPNVYFYHATGIVQSKNLATYFGRIYQMRYLSGIVAGMQTESDEIGYVASFPIAEVNRGINAFTLGVRAVNPNAKVHVKWCRSWEDDKVAEQAADTLVSEYGVDVLAMHIDSNSVLDYAEENEIWSIGYNLDNTKRYPNTFLTAPVWRWENYYEPYLLKCLQGKFEGENYWEGTLTGVVGLAPLSVHVKPGILDEVEAKRKMMESGTFDVFYGPIMDNQGNVRIEEGENMSDEALLNRFDWYVDGVEIHD